MNKLHKTVLITASLLLVVGAGCTQATTTTTVPANTNSTAVVVANTNTEQGDDTVNTDTVVDDVDTNETVEVDNTNTDTESDETVDTSDWLSYTNEEFGFSFRYPNVWEVGGNNANHISVVVEVLDSLPVVEKIAPTSSSSPEIRDQNVTEKNNLASGNVSAFGGLLVRAQNTDFFRYIGYIEGGSIDIEYVTYIDDNKVTIRYLEGDNTDFFDALNTLGRTTLIKQYADNAIDNAVLKQNFETLGKIIATFQK
jgi:hypothetical protein